MLISNVEVFFYILDIFIFLIFNNFDKVTFDNYIFKNFIFFYSWICEIILHFAEKLNFIKIVRNKYKQGNCFY